MQYTDQLRSVRLADVLVGNAFSPIPISQCSISRHLGADRGSTDHLEEGVGFFADRHLQLNTVPITLVSETVFQIAIIPQWTPEK